ncbi:unnamed protein product [Nippostrongylus brasiliensis]|uniref:ShKT domain-containing protein n=1 Tax=Nippostrongylus brasiliensis TaxID=27835 RepID=A0A0N4XME1_NIPBR|nr:unnamed protein product [Nippostrongylus brasiliensis]
MLSLAFQLIVLAVIICPYAALEDCQKATREQRCSEIFENIDNCNEISYHPQLMECLVTCGKCDAFSCNNPLNDTILNCTALASQCNSTVWEKFMKDKCPLTCGKCDVKNANLCKDVSDSVQFCNSLDYYDHMTEQCGSTCNRCPANGQSSELFELSLICFHLFRDDGARIIA